MTKMVLYRWIGPIRSDAVLNDSQTYIAVKLPSLRGCLWSVSQVAYYTHVSRGKARRALDGLVKLGMAERWSGGYKPLGREYLWYLPSKYVPATVLIPNTIGM